jgi:hypothetical protein
VPLPPSPIPPSFAKSVLVYREQSPTDKGLAERNAGDALGTILYVILPFE